jgi:LuxR family maltose regulon positive regulatory protein
MVRNLRLQPVRLSTRSGSPRIGAAFARQRLFRALDRSRRRQCTWIGAPGGYGKTYLLETYIRTISGPAIWYDLDKSDSDVVSFFADFSEIWEARGFGPLLRLSPDVEQMSRFSRLYFQQLGDAVEAPILIILDDYQRVAAGSGLHEAIAAAIGYLPSSIHLVVLSRETPPPAFARVQSHLQIGVIGADELALRPDEAIGIARVLTGEILDPAAVLEACQRAGGWAAGFVVLLGQPDPSSTAPDSQTTLFHYFNHEVLNKATDDLRQFLWRTALFPKFSSEMAERLTGQTHTATILRTLIGGNYFLRVTQSSAPLYHYHDLFRDYLLDYGRRNHPKDWQEAARRAAAILSDSGELDPAATLYAEVGHWEGLAQLINHHGEYVLQHGNHRTLARWLSLLPGEMKARHPWLVYWDGCCRLATDPRRARGLLQQAFVLFVQAGERLGALLAWAATCQAFWITFDDLRPLAGWLAELDVLWPVRDSALPQAIEGQVALGAFLCLIVARPDDPSLDYWERRLTGLLQSGCSPEVAAMAATVLLFHFVWTVGDRGRARMLREVLRAATGRRSIAPMAVVIARSWGDFSYEYGFGGSMPCCLEALDAAREIADTRGVHVYDATLYGGMAYCHLTSGQTQAAREALDQMEDALNWERTYDVGFHLWLRGWEAWLSGRYAEAWDLGHQEQSIAVRFGFMHPCPLSRLGAAQVANSLGRRPDALRDLAALGRWARRTGSRIGTYMRGLALAQFCLECGHRERARRILGVTLSLGQVEGYLGPPFFRPVDMTTICTEALAAGIEIDYIGRVIRSRNLPAPRTMESTEAWPWPVKIYVLGNFTLELDGNVHASKRKAQQKPLELLKALVALGGDAVPWERLADMLWPEAEGDFASSKFKTTLGRLRKLLGRHDYVVVEKGLVSVNGEYCWTDVWRFTELARRIDVAGRPSGETVTAARAEALTLQLTAAYPQPLLCNGREPWIGPLRRRYHHRYASCAEKLARLMDRSKCNERVTDIRAFVRNLDDAGCF